VVDDDPIARMRRQQAAVLAIASQQGRAGDLSALLREIATVHAETLEVERAGIWTLSEDRSQLRCLVQVERSRSTVTSGTVFEAKDFPAYFAAVESGRALATDDARHDPRTREFAGSYLAEHGITSMIDAAIREGGRVIGVVCGEHVGPPRAWTADEVAFAGEIADQAAMAFSAAERRRLQAERERMALQLAQKQRLESLGTLAAGVAHEINNPLTYVLANVDFAAGRVQALLGGREVKLADVAEALAEAREGVERVERIVRDLRSFARVGDDERGPVDPRQVIESTLNVVRNEIRHRARLVKNLGAVPHVEANESRLGQVVLNLLINAVQALPEGRAEDHELGVSTATDGAGRAVIEVRDTGCGIPAEALARIFDPFFSTKPVGSGMGLGLALTHGIVTSLGGEIQVESTVGEGSTFRVILPPAPPGARPARSPTPSPAGASQRRGRVLVVDDEPLVASSIARLLEGEHDVVTATRAEDALARAHAERFDVILCDLMMPDLAGMDFYHALGARDPDAARRVVFITGGAFTPGARAFLERVQAPCVEKPFNADRLRALVRERVG
jgi:signal transduction histidine kinase